MGFGSWNRAYKNPPPQAQKMSHLADRLSSKCAQGLADHPIY